MILEIVILATAIAFGILGLGFSWLFYKNSKQNRGLLEYLGKQVEDLEGELADSRQKLETSTKRVSDQSRRVAWLETRVRQPQPRAAAAIKEEVVSSAPVLTVQPKMSMTERRHQIITLAKRGQDAHKIASTLGMLPGEVELIINLNRVAI